MTERENMISRVEQSGLIEEVANFHKLDLQPLRDDLLIGAREVTKRIHGRDDKTAVRAMYNVLEKSKTIPSFRYGGQICVQMSSYRAKIWSQEKRAWDGPDEELLVRTHMLLNAALPLLAGLNQKQVDESDLDRLIAIAAETVETMTQLLKAQRT